MSAEKKAIAAMANLKRSVDYFLTLKEKSPESDRELAHYLGLAANTVGNWFPKSGEKPATNARVDKLAIVANKLNCEVWQLLHPDIQSLQRDLDRLESIRRMWPEKLETDESQPVSDLEGDHKPVSMPVPRRSRSEVK